MSRLGEYRSALPFRQFGGSVPFDALKSSILVLQNTLLRMVKNALFA